MANPDLDLIALAGFTKRGLGEVDQTSVGGTPRADHIDLQGMIGNPNQNRPSGGNMQRQNPNHPKRNILGNFNFIEEPKSRPIGRVDMDGTELPPIPEQNMPEFIQPPEDLFDRVIETAENPPNFDERVDKKLPDVNVDGFDLFQHAIIKQILAGLDGSIAELKKSLESLESKREIIVNLIVGKK